MGFNTRISRAPAVIWPVVAPAKHLFNTYARNSKVHKAFENAQNKGQDLVEFVDNSLGIGGVKKAASSGKAFAKILEASLAIAQAVQAIAFLAPTFQALVGIAKSYLEYVKVFEGANGFINILSRNGEIFNKGKFIETACIFGKNSSDIVKGGVAIFTISKKALGLFKHVLWLTPALSGVGSGLTLIGACFIGAKEVNSTIRLVKPIRKTINDRKFWKGNEGLTDGKINKRLDLLDDRKVALENKKADNQRDEWQERVDSLENTYKNAEGQFTGHIFARIWHRKQLAKAKASLGWWNDLMNDTTKDRAGKTRQEKYDKPLEVKIGKIEKKENKWLNIRKNLYNPKAASLIAEFYLTRQSKHNRLLVWQFVKLGKSSISFGSQSVLAGTCAVSIGLLFTPVGFGGLTLAIGLPVLGVVTSGIGFGCSCFELLTKRIETRIKKNISHWKEFKDPAEVELDDEDDDGVRLEENEDGIEMEDLRREAATLAADDVANYMLDGEGIEEDDEYSGLEFSQPPSVSGDKSDSENE